MGEVLDIIDGIEEIVMKRKIGKGEIILIPERSYDEITILLGRYIGDKRFEYDVGQTRDHENPGRITYDLSLKFQGEQNA